MAPSVPITRGKEETLSMLSVSSFPKTEFHLVLFVIPERFLVQSNLYYPFSTDTKRNTLSILLCASFTTHMDLYQFLSAHKSHFVIFLQLHITVIYSANYLWWHLHCFVPVLFQKILNYITLLCISISVDCTFAGRVFVFYGIIFSKSRFSKVEVLNLRVSGWGTFEGFGEGKEESGIDMFKIKYILKCQIQNTENHVILDVL